MNQSTPCACHYAVFLVGHLKTILLWALSYWRYGTGKNACRGLLESEGAVAWLGFRCFACEALSIELARKQLKPEYVRKNE